MRMKRSAYVLASLVQPGDVLISVGSKWPVGDNVPLWAIRCFTMSRFTHASVFMTRLGRLETNGPGLKSQLTVDEIMQDHGGRLLLNPSCMHAKLLRPTEEALRKWKCRQKNSTTDFGQVIRCAVLAYLGREYSEPIDLRGAALWPFRFFVESLAICLCGRRERRSSIVRRWFCSSLVAQAFQDADLLLANKEIGNISPGTILRSKVLQPITEAIIELPSTDLTLYRCQAPKRLIGGSLSEERLPILMQQAFDHIRKRGDGNVVAQLEQNFMKLIAKPSNDLKALLDYEKILQKNGML